MADPADFGRKRKERHNLLIALKETVEGILAIGSTNVWNTYGGLSRLCRGVENILLHGLRGVEGSDATCVDYWSYVKGLRRLNPVLAPTIERINRMAKTDPDELTRGQLWIRQSLLDHSLSIQLTILVENRQHLVEHYIDDAFLCSKEYYAAMLICLQAVEQNKAALLAEINPSLLKLKQKKTSHVRSASLPVNKPTPAIAIRRRSSQDRLAPTFASPKKDESFMSASEMQATPRSRGSSPQDVKISAKSQLLSVLEKSGDAAEIETTNEEFGYILGQDPLLNIDVSKTTKRAPPERRKLGEELRDLDFEKRSRRSWSLRSDGKNSDLLDKILNNDSDIEENSSDDEQNGRLTRSRSNLLVTNYSSNSLLDIGRGDGSVESLLSDSDKDNSDSTRNENLDFTIMEANLKKKSKKTHKRSKSDHALSQQSVKVNRNVIHEYSDDIDTHGLSSSLPNRVQMPPGGTSDHYFPLPRQGQSLRSFLASQDFNTCAELDKENAHFSISEALIAAIEQMKWNHVIKPHVMSDPESDEEIRELQQRIRIRRRKRLEEKARVLPSSDGRTDTTTTSTSPSFTHDVMAWSDSLDSSDIDEREIDVHVDGRSSPSLVSNLTALQDTGLSLSLGSLYSEAELKTAANKPVLYEKVETLGYGSDSQNVSAAELVAINLLKRFSENQLPKASDLDWLVSEIDVPQALLPLPDSLPISPDDCELGEFAKKTRIRGNLEWAPPRAQIIFNIHPPPKRKVLMAKQNYRCAGCGTKVEIGYMKRLRYCEYLGKFFCQCCHANAMSFIPGRILRKWDFSKYTMSNFSKDLLSKMYNDPLFNISDINPLLYRKVRTLEYIRECRVQLFHIQTFIRTCRLASGILSDLQKIPSHWTTESEIYSLSDLVKVKYNEMLPELRNVVADSICHISACQLCQAKGFICELCNNENDVLFPFELNRVSQCPVCRACYHVGCTMPEKCPKCARIEIRKNRLSVVALSSPEESDPEIPIGDDPR